MINTHNIKKEIIDKVVSFYLESNDFNGIPIKTLFADIKRENINTIKELVTEGLISINWGYPHENIHILAYPPLEIEKQIEWLDKLNIKDLIPDGEPIFQNEMIIVEKAPKKNFCIYPTKKLLLRKVNRIKYKNKPFVLQLALGEPQLKPYFFDLSVLDDYISDPRYLFESSGLDGSIYINGSKDLPQKDNVFIKTFGYGIKLDKKSYERCVVVYLRYLANVAPNQQQRWMTKIIRSKKFFVHPEYDRMTRGIWALKLSIFHAFTEELKVINEMTMKAFGKKIFKKDTFNNREIATFHFIIRPTRKLYYEFIHVLDKLLSENIDKSFFTEEFVEQIKASNKNVTPGTLLLLDKWLEDNVRFVDPKPKEEMIKTFKDIRKERQKPGHNIYDDEWNKKYWSMQRNTIMDAYGALRALRLIFANHRSAKSVKVSEWLYKGEICAY